MRDAKTKQTKTYWIAEARKRYPVGLLNGHFFSWRSAVVAAVLLDASLVDFLSQPYTAQHA